MVTDFFIDYVPLYNKFRAPSSILVVVELLFPLIAILGLYRFFMKPDEKPILDEEYKRDTYIRVDIDQNSNIDFNKFISFFNTLILPYHPNARVIKASELFSEEVYNRYKDNKPARVVVNTSTTSNSQTIRPLTNYRTIECTGKNTSQDFKYSNLNTIEHNGSDIFDKSTKESSSILIIGFDKNILFMNTISTIVRNRTDVKIFMLGNTVNKYSPYFEEMGLKNVKEQIQGTIDVYKYGNSKLKVAVEYCKASGKSKENSFYFAFDNPKLEMIKTGAWELDIFPHCPIKYKPKDILFIYFIEFGGELFQCEIVNKDNNIFTFIHEKTTPLKNSSNDLIYSLDFNPQINYNRNIYIAPSEITKKVKSFFIMDKVYYQDNNVGNTIANYLKACKGGL